MNYLKLQQLLVSLAILLLATSCSLFEKDNTLKPEAYQRLGMPDHKKVWTNEDYASCNITLSSLKMNDPLSLPRKNSRKSGPLFNRMVSEENLAFIHDTIFPLRNLAYTIQYYPRFQTEMEQMYTVEYKGEIYYSEELLELHILGLLVHDKMLELGWIIAKSDDEDVEGIKSGMESVKYNYLKLMPRLLDEVAKSSLYSADGIERLTRFISASLNKNQEWMTPSDRKNLLPKFRKAFDSSKEPGIKSNLQACIEVLNS